MLESSMKSKQTSSRSKQKFDRQKINKINDKRKSVKGKTPLQDASMGANGESIKEEGALPEEVNPSLEEESTSSAFKANPTIEEERPSVQKEYSANAKERPSVPKENPVNEDERPCIEEECPKIDEEENQPDKLPTAKKEEKQPDKLLTAEEKEHQPDKLPSAEEKENQSCNKLQVNEKERPFMGEERPTVGKKPQYEQKQYQTNEKDVCKYVIHTEEEEDRPNNKLPSVEEDEHEPPNELPSAAGDQVFFDNGYEMNSTAQEKPERASREIRSLLRREKSSSFSLNGIVETDSGATLEECSSIEEESPTETTERELIRLTAQVMIHEETTDAWIVEGEGEESEVTVVKIQTVQKPGQPRVSNKYVIKGVRLSSRQQNMFCVIESRLVYKKVSSTFHHWKVGDVKFGLVFNTSEEGINFCTVVARAVQAQSEGGDYLCSSVFFMQCDDNGNLLWRQARFADVMPEDAIEVVRRLQASTTTRLPNDIVVVHRASPPRCTCPELYRQEARRRRELRLAQDRVRAVVDRPACDPVEERSHPCTCPKGRFRHLRRAGLCLLSFVLPCMLLHPRVRGCFSCRVHSGLCGGRHNEDDAAPAPRTA